MLSKFKTYWITPLVLIGAATAWQANAAEIDFENLDEGEIVSEVSSGAGVSGGGNKPIGVFGFNPKFPAETNAAVIFDSGRAPGDFTNDEDLGTPNEDFGGPGVDRNRFVGTGGHAGSPFQNDTPLDNILIVNKSLIDVDPADGLVDDPNDDDKQGQFLEFDFSALKGGGKGTATINSVTYIDNDEGEFNAQIEMFGPDIPDQFIALTSVGDNGMNTIFGIGVDGVQLLRIVLNGSGAVGSVVFNEEVQRPCWVTLGGFRTAEVESAAGPKQCTFGGNVGPPPNGALEVNWHDGPLEGQRFHTNDIQAVVCLDSGSTGPQQPGGKKGLEVDTLVFECNGLFNNMPGYTCAGEFVDGGEPAGKKGNDRDRIEVMILNSDEDVVAECIGELAGGNIQIHPPVGPPL